MMSSLPNEVLELVMRGALDAHEDADVVGQQKQTLRMISKRWNDAVLAACVKDAIVTSVHTLNRVVRSARRFGLLLLYIKLPSKSYHVGWRSALGRA